jgi:phage portal protein BeeE
MIGGETGKSMTYANVEQQSLNLVTYTLRPYLTKLESAFSLMLPRPQYVRFNLDALLRADLKTRYEAHQIALASKFKTPDEVRDLEELPPLTDEQKAEILKASPKPRPAPPREEEDPDANKERTLS